MSKRVLIVLGCISVSMWLALVVWFVYVQWWVHPEYTRAMLFWAYPAQMVSMVLLLVGGIAFLDRGTKR